MEQMLAGWIERASKMLTDITDSAKEANKTCYVYWPFERSEYLLTNLKRMQVGILDGSVTPQGLFDEILKMDFDSDIESDMLKKTFGDMKAALLATISMILMAHGLDNPLK